MRVIAFAEHIHAVALCERVKIYVNAVAFASYISLFLINIAFRVRRNVLHREDDFLFNGSNGENFVKIPLTDLDRGKNPSMF